MKSPPPQRQIRFGVPESFARSHHVPRHQHTEAYATLVLGGRYEQLAYAGRLRLESGDVVLQPTFDCHSDCMLSAGLEILRLPWRRESGFGGVYRGCRVDLIRTAARRDLRGAVALLEEDLASRVPVDALMTDWTDALAIALRNPRLPIGTWADGMHLSRERVSRGFRSAYGVSPVQFRAEMRARAAWLRLTGTRDPMSSIAVDLAFSDQAHMTRSVAALTGATPSVWRRMYSLKSESEHT
jgi:AraC-like DNA-binding protein